MYIMEYIPDCVHLWEGDPADLVGTGWAVCDGSRKNGVDTLNLINRYVKSVGENFTPLTNNSNYSTPLPKIVEDGNIFVQTGEEGFHKHKTDIVFASHESGGAHRHNFFAGSTNIDSSILRARIWQTNSTGLANSSNYNDYYMIHANANTSANTTYNASDKVRVWTDNSTNTNSHKHAIDWDNAGYETNNSWNTGWSSKSHNHGFDIGDNETVPESCCFIPIQYVGL